MRRHTISPLAAAAAGLLLAALATPTAALAATQSTTTQSTTRQSTTTQSTTPQTGALTVQLATADGTSVARSGVRIGIYPSDSEDERELTTGATGSVTFPGLNASATFGIETEYVPDTGATTLTNGILHSIAVNAGTTSTADLVVAVGATVTGTVVGPTGAAAPLYTQVIATSPTGGEYTDATDAAGRYSFDGLATGIYTFEVSLTGRAPGEWKTRVVQQIGQTPASHVTLSKHLVHSDYDLLFDVSDSQSSTAITGASVQVVNSEGTVLYSEKTSEIKDDTQDARLEIPSGTYRVRLVTTAGAGLPQQTLWVERGLGSLTKYAADAAQVPVTFGRYQWFLLKIPASGADTAS